MHSYYTGPNANFGFLPDSERGSVALDQSGKMVTNEISEMWASTSGSFLWNFHTKTPIRASSCNAAFFFSQDLFVHLMTWQSAAFSAVDTGWDAGLLYGRKLLRKTSRPNHIPRQPATT